MAVVRILPTLPPLAGEPAVTGGLSLAVTSANERPSFPQTRVKVFSADTGKYVHAAPRADAQANTCTAGTCTS